LRQLLVSFFPNVTKESRAPRDVCTAAYFHAVMLAILVVTTILKKVVLRPFNHDCRTI
jgi:hypothetical protein